MLKQQKFSHFPLFLTAYCLLLTAAAAPLTFAQVPRLIRYQGMLKDSQGVPLEGPYTLTFRLYAASSGGTALWTETQSNVPVTTGSFGVLLGQVTVLDPIDWGQPCWLSIQVNAEAELSPRQQITSVPLAIRAEKAEQLTTPVTTSNITDDNNRLVPSGAIILWASAACPAGYSRVTAYDNLFLVGSTAAGTSGGANDVALTTAQMPSHVHIGPSHTHTTPAHTHGINRTTGNAAGDTSLGYNIQLTTLYQSATTQTGKPPGSPEGAGVSAPGGDGQTSSTGGNQSFDNRPAFKTILLCQKN